ncbi:hypothetical protein [uncultured phage cr106_1]|uniref:Uncharacterized protein n=1 Tax=uncultured phage cr106_1 TaxID=2772062 RepID=A0A7M1RVJ2_9CAUD|nr:hypothetical protein KNV29_gp039 [uncultured phage cr106_1]QOR58348.1 hypothetical protein [uncultured phage cr106_1]
MDELAKLQTEALDNYFIALSQFGYKSYDDVYKLLALLFLDELLTDFKSFITEEDLRTISRVVYCLCGTTCLIDFPEYYDKVEEIEPFIIPPIKFTDAEFQMEGVNITDYKITVNKVIDDNYVIKWVNTPLRNELYPSLSIPSYILRVKTNSKNFQIQMEVEIEHSIFERERVDYITPINKSGDYIIPAINENQRIITFSLWIFSYSTEPIVVEMRGIK